MNPWPRLKLLSVRNLAQFRFAATLQQLALPTRKTDTAQTRFDATFVKERREEMDASRSQLFRSMLVASLVKFARLSTNSQLKK